MDGVDSDEEREGGGEMQDTFDGSTPTSSISEISPGLSRFLLHISGSSPPASSEVPFLESGAWFYASPITCELLYWVDITGFLAPMVVA